MTDVAVTIILEKKKENGRHKKEVNKCNLHCDSQYTSIELHTHLYIGDSTITDITPRHNF